MRERDLKKLYRGFGRRKATLEKEYLANGYCKNMAFGYAILMMKKEMEQALVKGKEVSNGTMYWDEKSRWFWKHSIPADNRFELIMQEAYLKAGGLENRLEDCRECKDCTECEEKY